MHVGQEQLKAIPVGAKATYKVDHPRQLQNIRAIASYTHLSYPELGVKFRTSICRPKMEITVWAEPVEQPKKKKGQKV